MKYFPLVLLIALMSITFEETFSATTTKKSQISVKTLKKDTKKTPVVPKKSSCDPNYSGCVPIASDVDCA